MNFLTIILLFGLYLIIGRVIVITLVKKGHISKDVYDFCEFFTYVFLPLTLFILVITVVSDWIIKYFKIR
jgi:hypothetical protein